MQQRDPPASYSQVKLALEKYRRLSQLNNSTDVSNTDQDILPAVQIDVLFVSPFPRKMMDTS